MRLFTILKDTILAIRTIRQLVTDGSTLEDRYVIFPNGLKICWGTASGLKNAGSFTVPISFTDGRVAITPIYNTGTTIRSIPRASVSGNKVTVGAWDTYTNTLSTSTTLAFHYIVIGY